MYLDLFLNKILKKNRSWSIFLKCVWYVCMFSKSSILVRYKCIKLILVKKICEDL